MKYLILFIVLLSSQMHAQTPVCTWADWKLKTGGKVQTVTYQDLDSAKSAAETISKNCFCQVDIIQPVITCKTAKPVSSNASSVKSSPASSTAQAGPIKPVSVTTSTNYDSNIGALTIDGNPATRWESVWLRDPQWLQLDLGKSYPLGRIEIDWEDSNAEAYIVEGSINGSVWVPLVTFSDGAFGGRTDSLSLAGSYRYVRITATKRPAVSQWGYSIYEIRLTSAGATSSSKASSTASSSSSSVAPVAPIAVQLQLTKPTKRENGEALPPEKIKGFNVINSQGQTLVFVNTTQEDPVIFDGVLNFRLGELLQVATVDTDNVYSKYVPFQ